MKMRHESFSERTDRRKEIRPRRFSIIRLGAAFLAAALLLTPLFAGAPAKKKTLRGSRGSQSSIGQGNPTLYKHYKGLEAYGVEDAWKMGITGKGVRVAVSDSGIDFGHPDLYGSQARVTTKKSPYLGWPIVIDLFSTTAWQDSGIAVNQFINMSSTDTSGCQVPGTSKSGVYHIGDHPDYRMTNLYGRPVKILMVDEKKKGVYDTVYMDLNGNRDFRDDKPCRKGDEIAIWDRDKDGLADESGGIIYFIADGATPVPLGRLLYGAKARIPKNAELLAIHYDTGGHGTMCAGTIGARGRIVKGMAPGASLIPVDAFPDDIGMLITSLGYDGKPETGDEANLISRSAGFPYGQKGGDELSSFLEYLTTKVVPRTTFIFAASNEGSGYATLTSPSAPHVITAGAIEDLWFKNSPNRGDVAAFSARGPNVVGFPKPTVLGTGAFSPRVRPLPGTHNGASAFDMHGGGTSNGTPHVSGVVALIYQAYKQSHKVFPTSEIVRDILMSSADDINDEPFAQGSGMINGLKAARLALRKDGILAKPAVLSPDKPIAAGSRYDERIKLESYARKDIKAVPQRLVRTGSKTIKVPASRVKELVAVPKEFLNADLLRISSYVPSEGHRDWTLDDTARFGYWLSAYDWRDLNRDGSFGPENVEMPENAQKGEVVILANTDWGGGGTSEVRLHDPLKRVGNGLLLGLKHTTMDPGREVEAAKEVWEDADVVIVIESFTWQPWDSLKVVRKGADLECSLKAPEHSGIYQGRILLTSDGGKYKQSIPVGFSVYSKDGIRIAGTDEIYENNRVYARIEGSGRDGYRDDRIFAINHQGKDLLSLKVSWEDPLTEMDMALYAPGTVDTSKIWSYSGAAPIKFPVLPAMKEVGRTPRRYQTGHTLSAKTNKTLIANAEDGVHILVVNSTNNSRNRYGENIKIEAAPVTVPILEKTELTGTAGSYLEFLTNVDAVYGFSQPLEIQPSREGYRFEARRGDRLLIKFGKYSDAVIVCDTDGDGKGDENLDEVVLRDGRWGILTPDRGMVVTLPFDGTYYLTEFEGTIVLLPHRLAAKDGRISTVLPFKAGTYYGVSEIDGNIVRGDLTLEVKPAEALRLDIKPAAEAVLGRPFGIDLKVLDAYGNVAARDMEASLTIEGVEKKVQIKAGQGRFEIPAPDKTGRFSLVARTSLGLDAAKVNVIKGTPVAVEAVNVTQKGVSARLVNMSGSDLEATVYANPAGMVPAGNDSGVRSVDGFCLAWLQGRISSSCGQSQGHAQGRGREDGDTAVHGQGQNRPVETPERPYIVAAVGREPEILGYGMSGNVPQAKPEDAAGYKKASQIKETPMGEKLTFAADGLVALRLNDEIPLFFKAAGVLTIVPDIKGTLTVLMGKETYTIQVIENAQAGPAAKVESKAEKAVAGAPGQVTDLKLFSEKDGIRIFWKAPATGDGRSLRDLSCGIRQAVQGRGIKRDAIFLKSRCLEFLQPPGGRREQGGCRGRTEPHHRNRP